MRSGRSRSLYREEKTEDSCILRTEKLDAGYNGRAVVCGVGLRLHKGEIMTLIGPNGGGKSTLLKTLSGQLPPVCGSVLLRGKDIRNMSGTELSRTMSLLMTERVDPELMTCEDVVSIGRYPYTGIMGNLSETDRDVVRTSMEMANVTSLKDRYFSRLSDGQRQRVLLARAICQEPEVLVMDEPTSYLDIRHKMELLQILERLVREKHVAAVVSLHETELAERIADTVVCVKDGRAETAGSTEEVFRRENIMQLFDITEEQDRWFYRKSEN